MLRLQLARLGKQPVEVVELNGHARRGQAFAAMRLERRGPLVVPPNIFQVKRHSTLGYPHAA